MGQLFCLCVRAEKRTNMESYNFLELFIAALFIAAFVGLVGYSVWVGHKNKRLANDLVQALVDKNSLAAKLNKTSIQEKPIDQTDGFLKFLSESRDSAFEYIEQTQAKLVAVQQELGPIVEVYKSTEKQTDSMKQVIKSYDDLMSLLPDNN